jgi:hypothetical protein
MKSDSALVSPFITVAELESVDAMDITEEQHTSKEWIDILTQLNAAAGVRPPPDVSGPFEFDEEALDDAEATGDGVDDVYHDAAADMVASGLRGAGALKMLTSTRLDSLKSFLPVINLFGSVKEEVIEDSAAESAASFPKLVSSVDSLLHLIPDGFAELDDKMKAAVQLIEEELTRLTRSHTILQEQVVGSVDATAFVEEFGSVCAGIMKAEQAAFDSKATGTAAASAAESASARAVSAEAEAMTVGDSLKTHSAKTAKIITALFDRFNGELAAVMQRIGSGSGPVPSPSQGMIDATSSDTLHLAGYHDRGTNSFTTGRSIREYERLTRNGFMKVIDFDTEEEARAWLRLKNGAPTALTPSSPNPRDELASGYSEGGIAAQISVLTDLVRSMETEITDLKRATVTKGVSIDKFSFDSIEDLVALIRSENIPTTAFGVAVDPVSFFCHHKSGSIDEVKSTNEMKSMRLAGITNVTALRYVHSFRHTHPAYFLNACYNPIRHGQRFPILDGESAWHGTGLSKGGCVELENAIEEITESVETYIEQNLPDGKFKDLCLKMLSLSSKWLSSVVTYLNREIKRVLKYGIPELKTYTLVSDQLHTMYEEMWSFRRLMQEFDKDADNDVEYFARGVWISMQALGVCAEFSSVNFASHTLISSVFVRFLAEETGSNFASGLTATIAELNTRLAHMQDAYQKVNKAMTARLDNHAETLQKLCAKSGDIKFVSKGAKG